MHCYTSGGLTAGCGCLADHTTAATSFSMAANTACPTSCLLQARAAELRRQKAEHEKAWAAAQRERELQKVWHMRMRNQAGHCADTPRAAA